MSKKTEKGDKPDPGENDAGKGTLTIEEHKENLNISAPVFAAVMQTQKWGGGKRVPEADFKKAVEDFLGAPMDGAKNDVPVVGEQKEKSDDSSGGGE
jgi:hypothetical protein